MSPGTQPERGRLDLVSNQHERAHLRGRVADLAGEVDRVDLVGLVEIVDDEQRSLEDVRSHLSTQLMEQFRRTCARGCFGLLYELNRTHLLGLVVQRLRRYQSRADPNDLLQEVFFNIYRYPRRFDSTKPDAFRIWTTTIVRNTVLKQMRSLGRSGRAEVPFEDLSEHPEETAQGPLGGAIERESEVACKRVYLVYLSLYLEFYKRLSSREQAALRLVEVEGVSYRDAADALGIKLENLKMIIFRARRKITRAMKRVFDGLPPELRPAREPKQRRAKLSAAATAATAGSTARGSGVGPASPKSPQGPSATEEKA